MSQFSIQAVTDPSASQFAMSDGQPKLSPLVGGFYLTFEVAPEIVDQNVDWSQPVRFKFEKHDGGMVTMWLQTACGGPSIDVPEVPDDAC